MTDFRPIYWSRRLRRAGREARRRLRANEMVRGAPAPEPSGDETSDEGLIWFAANRPVLFWWLATMDITFVLITVVVVAVLVLLG